MTEEQIETEKETEIQPVINIKPPGWVVFTLAVFYPLFTIGFELFTQMCAESLFDPMPTIFHKILLLIVPLANFLVWKQLRSKRILNIRSLMLLCTISIGVSGFYTLIFLPVTPFAVVGIIFFGYGLLPLAPLVSFIMGIRLYGEFKGEHDKKLVGNSFLLKGISISILLLMVIDIPSAVTKWGVNLAVSDSIETRERGIRLLQSMGSKDQLLGYCYDGNRRTSGPLSFVVMIFGQHSYISSSDAREIFYRVTGELFNTYPVPYQGGRWDRFDEFSFDADQGGTEVGGRIKGLELITSKIDGSISGDDGVAYFEWTLEFKNDSSRQREARVQIALPPNAVVSRATLWINDEEREAAFAGKGKARQAYERVVRRRQDPLLVTSVGADRILAQAFPIAAKGGTIKFRLGMTTPLSLNNRENASLVLPAIVDRNFGNSDDVKHTIWIESKKIIEINSSDLSSKKISENVYRLKGNISDIELSNPRKTITTVRKISLSQLVSQYDNNQQIVQQVVEIPNKVKEVLMIVVDGSVKSGKYIDQVIESLKTLPQGQKVGLLIASGDNPFIEIDHWSEEQQNKFIKLLNDYEFIGGQDNAPALAEALLKMERFHDAEILWIHSPQPIVFAEGLSKLEQVIERLPQLPLINSYGLRLGPNKLLNKLSSSFKWTLNSGTIAKKDSAENDLKEYFLSRYSTNKQLVFERIAVENVKDVPQGSKHIARLWARDKIRALMRDDPKNQAKAIEIAAKYQLVTLVSGAVVLEDQKQYDDNGLNPVDANSVPTIPEPHQWVLAFIILLMLLWFLRQNKFTLIKPL